MKKLLIICTEILLSLGRGALINSGLLFYLVMTSTSMSFGGFAFLLIWVWFTGEVSAAVVRRSNKKVIETTVDALINKKCETAREGLDDLKRAARRALTALYNDDNNDFTTKDKMYVALVHLLTRGQDKQSDFVENLYIIGTDKNVLQTLDPQTSDELEQHRESLRNQRKANETEDKDSSEGITF